MSCQDILTLPVTAEFLLSAEYMKVVIKGGLLPDVSIDASDADLISTSKLQSMQWPCVVEAAYRRWFERVQSKKFLCYIKLVLRNIGLKFLKPSVRHDLSYVEWTQG